MWIVGSIHPTQVLHIHGPRFNAPYVPDLGNVNYGISPIYLSNEFSRNLLLKKSDSYILLDLKWDQIIDSNTE